MITDYFEEVGIEYWESGKNVSAGWVGLQCVYCDDSSNHLGVELATGRVSCWLCGGHGKVVNLLMEIEQCSYARAKQLLDKWWEGDFDTAGIPKLPPSPAALARVALPPIIKEWPEKYLSYLRDRGYSPRSLITKYKLMPAHRFGSYGFRIIAPFFVGKKMVGYTGLDITGKKEAKYKDSAKKDSIMPPTQCLYNIDNIKNGRAVIVEGITDVWRIGDGAVALGTNKINDFQILQLIKKDIKKAFILLDADAANNMDDIAELIIATMTVDVEIGYLEEGDPDKMSHIDLLKVRKWLS